MRNILQQAALEDVIFWATTFWQEQKQAESKNEMPQWFLPDEAAETIAENMRLLGNADVTAETVQTIYRKWL